MATRDKNYLVQLGYSLQDGKIFQEFNLFNVLEELESDYFMVNDLNVLNIGGISLGKPADEWELTPERREAFERALETGEINKIEQGWEGQPAVYRYIPYESEYDSGSTQSKVVEVVYNDHELQTTLTNDRQILIFQLLIILLVTIILSLVLSKWMSKPIHMAFHDSLTGLKNRNAFEEDLYRLLKKNKGTLAVFMIDLDNFKLVNDHLGHDQGDDLLQQVAVTMKDFISTDGDVYRMGGDEFSIIIPSTNHVKVKEISQSIIVLLRKKLADMKEINDLDVTASIGISLAPEHGNNEKVLYKKADMALYLSKKEGKNRYHIFEE